MNSSSISVTFSIHARCFSRRYFSTEVSQRMHTGRGGGRCSRWESKRDRSFLQFGKVQSVTMSLNSFENNAELIQDPSHRTNTLTFRAHRQAQLQITGWWWIICVSNASLKVIVVFHTTVNRNIQYLRILIGYLIAFTNWIDTFIHKICIISPFMHESWHRSVFCDAIFISIRPILCPSLALRLCTSHLSFPLLCALVYCTFLFGQMH